MPDRLRPFRQRSSPRDTPENPGLTSLDRGEPHVSCECLPTVVGIPPQSGRRHPGFDRQRSNLVKTCYQTNPLEMIKHDRGCFHKTFFSEIGARWPAVGRPDAGKGVRQAVEGLGPG